MNEDILITFGSTVKRLDEKRFGAHLVLFTSADSPDLTDDFFSKSTDFDIFDGDRRSGYYNHGLDVKIGNQKIGTGTLKIDDVGVWLEGQLKDRDEYVEAVWGMIEQGKLGLSSGAVSHLVRRESVPGKKSVQHITHWPIGEWSLTPTPAEPRTCAIPLKSWADHLNLKYDLSDFSPEALNELPFMKHTEAVGLAVEDLLRRASWVRELRASQKAGRTLSKETRARLMDIHSGLSQHCGMIAAMCGEDAEEDAGKGIQKADMLALLRLEELRALELGISL